MHTSFSCTVRASSQSLHVRRAQSDGDVRLALQLLRVPPRAPDGPHDRSRRPPPLPRAPASPQMPLDRSTTTGQVCKYNAVVVQRRRLKRVIL